MFPIDKFENVEIEQVNDTRAPTARYYRNRARGNKAPFYMIALTTAPLPYAEYMEVSAQIESYENELELFDLNNPLPALATFSNKNVQATAIKGAKTVVIQGNNAFRVGDYIQFNNHKKVYRISSVTRSTNTTIDISCPLVEPVNTSTDLIYGENVVFQVSLNSNYTQKVDGKNSNYGVVDVELIEQA